MILTTMTVDEFQTFWSVFSSTTDLRARYDSKGVRVFRNLEDEHEVWLLYDWDQERYAAFRADPEVRAAMKAAGLHGAPDARFLDEAGELPA